MQEDATQLWAQTLLPGVKEVFQALTKKDARPAQLDVIAALWGGDDVFAQLPCNAGKTMIMYVWAAMSQGTSIFVVPTVALTIMHTKALENAGFIDFIVVSSKTLAKVDEALARDMYPDGRLAPPATALILLCSPETLAYIAPQIAKSNCVTVIGVDEAHTILTWGDRSFRPAFDRIGNVVRSINDVKLQPQVVCLSANATKEERRVIMAKVGRDLGPAKEVVLSPSRLELQIFCIEKAPYEYKLDVITALASKHKTSLGIVYVKSVPGAHKLANAVSERICELDPEFRGLVQAYTGPIDTLEQEAILLAFAGSTKDLVVNFSLESWQKGARVSLPDGSISSLWTANVAPDIRCRAIRPLSDMIELCEGKTVRIESLAPNGLITILLPDGLIEDADLLKVSSARVVTEASGGKDGICGGVLIVTSAFVNGISIDGITWAVVFDAPSSLIDAYQFISRAAREKGASGICVIFFSIKETRDNAKLAEKMEDPAAAKRVFDGCRFFYLAASNQTVCRQQMMNHMVEIPDAVVCSAAHKCDVCREDAVPILTPVQTSTLDALQVLATETKRSITAATRAVSVDQLLINLKGIYKSQTSSGDTQRKKHPYLIHIMEKQLYHWECLQYIRLDNSSLHAGIFFANEWTLLSERDVIVPFKKKKLKLD